MLELLELETRQKTGETLSNLIMHYSGIEPTRAHEEDAGLDFKSAEETFTLQPGEHKAVDTGTRVAIPVGHGGLLVARSGLGAKHGIVLRNTIGVIDAGYTGPVIATLVNTGSEPVVIEKGSRIAQLLVVPVATGVQLIHVDELDETTERGAGGFGSSGTE